jgi:fructose-1,6-bisphosphatase/inositol monophosphatase family enzyme
MESATPSKLHITLNSDSSPEQSVASFNTTAATTPSSTPDVLANKLAKYDVTVEDLHRVQDVFIELAEAAGTMMLNAEFDVLAQAATKNNTSDLVSDYDKAIETMVHARLTEEFPNFDFLGEESYTHGQKLGDKPTFIVDPVDGTINFTRGFPNFAISMALAVEKYPVVGMVYNPGQGNLWSAIENHGAFLTRELFVARKKLTDPLELKNQDPILKDAFGMLSVGQGKTAKATPMVEKEDPMSMTTAQKAAKELEGFTPTFKLKMAELPKYKLPITPIPPPMPALKKRLIAIEWGNERKGPNWALRTDVHDKLLTDEEEDGKMILSCRSSGSAALDFCYVAAGMFDAFWEGGVWCWDVAAGWLMVKEAGGIVASANPGDWHPTLEGRCYFPVRAAKREEQKALVQELWAVMGDRKFVYKDKKKPVDGTVSAAETA